MDSIAPESSGVNQGPLNQYASLSPSVIATKADANQVGRG